MRQEAVGQVEEEVLMLELEEWLLDRPRCPHYFVLGNEKHQDPCFLKFSYGGMDLSNSLSSFYTVRHSRETPGNADFRMSFEECFLEDQLATKKVSRGYQTSG